MKIKVGFYKIIRINYLVIYGYKLCLIIYNKYKEGKKVIFLILFVIFL